MVASGCCLLIVSFPICSASPIDSHYITPPAENFDSMFVCSVVVLVNRFFVLWLHIQDNADRSSSFVILINLLRQLDPLRWPSPAANETLAVRNQKFSDLVVKCLIKTHKGHLHFSLIV